MLKRIFIGAIFVLLGFVKNVSSQWCIPLDNMTEPNITTAKALISFFKEPWSEWTLNMLRGQIGEKSEHYRHLKRIYEKLGFNPVFFDSTLSPKLVVKTLVSELEPEKAKIGEPLDKVIRIKESIKLNKPPVTDNKEVMVCPLREEVNTFTVIGLDQKKAEKVVEWAIKTRDELENLAKAVFEVDFLLSTAVLDRIKSKSPYDLYSWVSMIDKGKALISLLNYDGLEHFSGYKFLREALPHYERLASSDQVRVYADSKMQVGDSGEAIVKLQKRLIQEGYLVGKVTGVFDETTREAVMRFQKAHFVTPDGTVGKKTIEKLNISYAQKLEWIKNTLEAFPTYPLRLYNRLVWINIPTFSLEYYEDGKLVSRHKVIVGRADGKEITVKGRKVRWNNTLPLKSEIKSIVVNPRWYVPERIRLELEGLLAKNEYYYERAGFRTLESTYSWGEPRLYQLPGEKNPLGKVKFLFDNPYGFYLHDTSEPHLFKRSFRAISHGCIRVERALDLAKKILEKEDPRKVLKIEEYLKKPDQTHITLENPVPIVITYLAVWAEDNGGLLFGGDPYNWGSDPEIYRSFFYVKDF